MRKRARYQIEKIQSLRVSRWEKENYRILVEGDVCYGWSDWTPSRGYNFSVRPNIASDFDNVIRTGVLKRVDYFENESYEAVSDSSMYWIQELL